MAFSHKIMVSLLVALGATGALAAWTISGSTLTDGNWSFACTFSGDDNTDVTITSRTSGSGDLDLSGLPGDYKVVKINQGVFKGSGSVLTSFTEPDELEELVDYQFHGCGALTNFTGGGSVTKSGAGVFWTASNLAGSISFPLLEKAPNGFMNGCNKVKSISFPNATYIDNSAFLGCSAATNFVVDFSRITYIGDQAFYNCVGIKGDLVIPNTTQLAGLRGTKVTSVKAPKAQKIVGYCFFQVSTLTNIECEAVEKIDTERCFYQTKLTGEVRFPLIKKIESGCFSENTKMTSIDISSVTNLGVNALSGCSSLTNVVLNPQILEYLGDNCMSSTKIYGDWYLPEVKYISGFKWTKVTSVCAPKAETIGMHAFYNVSTLTNVYLGTGVKAATSDQQFTMSSFLTGDFEFPLLTTLPNNFMASTRVKSVDIRSATSIAANSFSSVALTNIVLGAATSLPASLFSGAVDGCDVTFLGDVPAFNSSTFDNPKSKPNRFHIVGYDYPASWRNACFALRGNPEYAAQWENCPKRTIGLIRANSNGDDTGWAYVIDENKYGSIIVVK